MKITKDMTIATIVEKCPKSVNIFLKHHMMCFGCAVAKVETLEEGCRGHGIDVDQMVKDLNEVAEEESE
jgi:hybrid cluster-associated redox disulfide protein